MEQPDETTITAGRAAERDEAHIDLVEERLRVAKRMVDSGGVRVSTEVETVEEAVSLALRQQAAEVERVAVDRVVETAPEPRLDGDTIIIPIIEERPVIATQLVVTEEIRVRLTETTREEQRSVPLRRERVRIDEIAPPADATATASGPIPSDEGEPPASPPDGDHPAH